MMKKIIDSLKAELAEVLKLKDGIERALTLLSGLPERQAGSMAIAAIATSTPRTFPNRAKSRMNYKKVCANTDRSLQFGCPRDGKPFTAHRADKRYCSRGCIDRVWRKQNINNSTSSTPTPTKASAPSVEPPRPPRGQSRTYPWAHCRDCNTLFQTAPHRTWICTECKSKKNSMAGKRSGAVKQAMAKKLSKPVTLIAGDNLSNKPPQA